MATPGETEEEAPPPIQRGIFDFEDGSTYEGEFIEVEGRPVRSGEGCWTLGPETSSGQWTDDAMQSGRITFASGSYFEGELRNGAYERGVFSWPDGSESSYEGTWRDQKPHGDGIYIDARGVEYKGTWHNGNYFDGRKYIDPIN